MKDFHLEQSRDRLKPQLAQFFSDYKMPPVYDQCSHNFFVEGAAESDAKDIKPLFIFKYVTK